MQWYYSQNGVQMGPVSQEELMAKLTSGALQWSDLVWRDGMSGWVAASAVSELRSASSASAPPTSPGQVFSPYTPPQSAIAGTALGPPPPTYLWQAIVVTFFCCLPFGIPAIVYAAKVDGLHARGDAAGARAASDSAKTWCWTAFWVGLGIGILWFGFSIFAGLASAGAASSSY